MSAPVDPGQWQAWMPRPAAAAPAPRRGAVLAWLFWIVIGSVAGFEFARLGLARALPFLLAAAAWLLACLWLQLLIHEAGHAIAGLLRGMRLIALGLGPLRLERVLEGWRWRWSRGIAGIGGFAMLSPAPGRTPCRRDTAIYAAGGAAANLLAAAAVWYSARDLGDPVRFASMVFACTGVAFGAINLLPFRSRGWRSDGLTLLQLWRRPREAQAALQTQALVARSLAGVRPRDWEAGLLPRSEPGFDPMLVRTIDLLRLVHALDAGHDAEAAEVAAAIAADHPAAPDGVRQNQALMLASFAARCARSEPLLAAWLPHAGTSLLTLDAHRDWLRAELALMQGDHRAAREHARTSRAGLPRVHDAASAAQLRDYLDELEQRISPPAGAS